MVIATEVEAVVAVLDVVVVDMGEADEAADSDVDEAADEVMEADMEAVDIMIIAITMVETMIITTGK
jgi:hypothetical protein